MNRLKSGVVVAVTISGICVFSVTNQCDDRGLEMVCEHSKVSSFCKSMEFLDELSIE